MCASLAQDYLSHFHFIDKAHINGLFSFSAQHTEDAAGECTRCGYLYGEGKALIVNDRPVIGIPCRYNWNTNYYELRETYPEALYAQGGTPLMLPLIPEPEYIESILAHVDAICLSGA